MVQLERDVIRGLGPFSLLRHSPQEVLDKEDQQTVTDDVHNETQEEEISVHVMIFARRLRVRECFLGVFRGREILDERCEGIWWKDY